MSAVIDAIVDVVKGVVDAVVKVVEAIWDNIVMPILEEIFSWFGIEDETVIEVESTSQYVFENDKADWFKDAIVRTVMENRKQPIGFLTRYIINVGQPAASMRSYYNYGENQYIYGLPTMNIKGASIDFVAVKAALDVEKSGDFVVIAARSTYPSPEEYYKEKMQTTHSYTPIDNTLTHTDGLGNTYADWTWFQIVFNTGLSVYEISVQRVMELATFWIEGPIKVIEGQTTANYTVKCDRTVPAGKSVLINLVYSGTAIPPGDYTTVPTVTMLENTNEVSFTLTTVDNGVVNPVRTISVTLNAVSNPTGTFERTAIDAARDTVTTSMVDEDTLMLYANDVTVDESAGNAVVDVVFSIPGAAMYSEDFEGGPYTLTDLNGNISAVIANPETIGNPSANVLQIQKSDPDVELASLFTGADAVLLTTHDATWVQHSSAATTAEIDGNRIEATANTSEAIYTNSVAPTAAEHYAQADIEVVTTTATTRAGVMVRHDATVQTGYYLVLTPNNANQVELFRYDAGTPVSLGSWAITGFSATTYRIRLEVTDFDASTVRLESFINGVSQGVTDDTSVNRITATGRYGLVVSAGDPNADLFLDNYLAGNFSTPLVDKQNANTKLTVAAIDFSFGEQFLVLVYSTVAVSVSMRLEQQSLELSDAHTGSGWETLVFDFTGTTTATPNTQLTFYFDKGAVGNYDLLPDDWTFYVDNIILSRQSFSVIYSFTDITAFGGTPLASFDYDNTAGILDFVGIQDEIQQITVPINSDGINDDIEQFRVNFANPTDPFVDVSQTAIVTIIDNTNPAPVPGTTSVTEIINQPTFLREQSMVVEYHTFGGNPNNWFYWIYPQSSNIYPNVKATATDISDLEMLPIAIIRLNKVNADVDKNADWYKTTKNLLKNLGLDIDDFLESISNNPAEADIDDAFVHFAVNPTEQTPEISKILFWTFYQFTAESVITSNINQYSATFYEGPNNDVNRAMVWASQSYTPTVVGNIGPIGTFTHTVVDTNLTLRYQDTATTYQEIQIGNINAMDAIKQGTFHNMVTMKLGDPRFSIPVSAFVVSKLSPLEQLKAYPYMLRFNAYALRVTHLEWYETAGFWDFFGDLLTVIAVVIFVTSGFDVTALVQKIIQGYAIQATVMAVAKITGSPELAALAGVALAVTFSTGGDISSIELLEPTKILELSTDFADNLAAGYALEIEDTTQKLEDAQEQYESEIERIQSLSPEESFLDAKYIAYVNGLDETMKPAIQSLYNYDSYYDTLTSNFYDRALTIGVQ